MGAVAAGGKEEHKKGHQLSADWIEGHQKVVLFFLRYSCTGTLCSPFPLTCPADEVTSRGWNKEGSKRQSIDRVLVTQS